MNLEKSLTMLPFLFTSMTHATLHEDMQPIQLGGGGLYSLSSLHFSTTIIPFFRLIYHLPTFFFVQRYFVALLFISIDIHIGMIHKYEKRLSYTQ
jgi:hypothetical protein